MSLFVRDCGCKRLQWVHDDECLWNVPVMEEPYDWQLEPNEDDQ